MTQIDTPVIELVSKLDTPEIELVALTKLDTPVIELVNTAGKLDTPTIKLVEESTNLSDWSTTVPTRVEGQFIWQRVKYIHADGSVTYDDPVCLTGDKGEDGKSGKDGKDGKDGSDGVGYEGVINYYLATNESSGISLDTDGWTVEVQSVSTENKYLWNYEKIIYTDGSEISTDPCIIGTYGSDGKDGESGVGIENVVEYYAVSSSNEVIPTNWVSREDGMPTMTATLKYLWNYEETFYTDGTSKESKPVIIGVYGDKGDKGETGADAITYQIDSSLGTQFLEGSEETTTLTARVFKGSVELDTDGNYGYEWYLVEDDNEEPTLIGVGKTIQLQTATLANKAIYFVADDSGNEEELVQLYTPSIELVVVLEKLETPIINLVEEE